MPSPWAAAHVLGIDAARGAVTRRKSGFTSAWRCSASARSVGVASVTTLQPSGAQRDGLVEADGRWLGSLAGAVQLGEGAVEEHPLRALLEGVDPSSGEILDARHARVRVVAFDAVFAAPKSVSILHALGPPQLRAAIGGEVHEAECRGRCCPFGARDRARPPQRPRRAPHAPGDGGRRGCLCASHEPRTRSAPAQSCACPRPNLARDQWPAGRWSAPRWPGVVRAAQDRGRRSTGKSCAADLPIVSGWIFTSERPGGDLDVVGRLGPRHHRRFLAAYGKSEAERIAHRAATARTRPRGSLPTVGQGSEGPYDELRDPRRGLARGGVPTRRLGAHARPASEARSPGYAHEWPTVPPRRCLRDSRRSSS